MEKVIGRISKKQKADAGSSLIRPSGQCSFLKHMKFALISVAVGEILTIFLLLLFSFLVCNVNLPTTISDILAITTGAFGAVTAGYLNGRLIREKGLLWGTFCGGIMLLILFLANVAFHQSSSLTFWCCKLIVILLAGAFGGIAGVNKPARKVRL